MLGWQSWGPGFESPWLHFHFYSILNIYMGFVLAVGRIQPMLELFETGSILGVILVPLFTMQWIWTCQYIAQVSLAYWYSVGMTILRSRVRIPVVALSFLFDSKHLYEAMIYWVYSCDYSLLEAPWSKLLALLDFIHRLIFISMIDFCQMINFIFVMNCHQSNKFLSRKKLVID